MLQNEERAWMAKVRTEYVERNAGSVDVYNSFREKDGRKSYRSTESESSDSPSPLIADASENSSLVDS